MLTLRETKERLLYIYDAEDFLEYLQITAEEILDRFEDKLERNLHLFEDVLEDEDQNNGSY